MNIKTASPERRTASMSSATAELPLLTDEERRALAASLVEAEARIKAGDFAEFEPQTFKDRLQRLYREARQSKDA